MPIVPISSFRPFTGLVLLRIVVAVIMITHSLHRMNAGTVSNFGEFLNSSIFSPIGLYVAWGITLFELVGGTLLVLGLYRRIICFGFMIQLFTGIVMVHLRNGWFVVGAGTNGIEYSVLLITSLIAIAFPHYKKKKKK